MISEKTVELNLTTELINHLSYRQGMTLFAVAPTQREEDKLGYDTAIGAQGIGVLIQYKRAYTEKNGYNYHINYTKQKDQHLRLLEFERKGFSVFYAFPMFHLVPQIAAGRRRLLTMTAWYRPSQINLPGGTIGKHEVHYNSKNNVWTVTSKEHNIIPNPLTISDVFNDLYTNKENDLSALLRTINNIISEGISDKNIGPASNDFTMNQFILGSLIDE